MDSLQISIFSLEPYLGTYPLHLIKPAGIYVTYIPRGASLSLDERKNICESIGVLIDSLITEILQGRVTYSQFGTPIAPTHYVSTAHLDNNIFQLLKNAGTNVVSEQNIFLEKFIDDDGNVANIFDARGKCSRHFRTFVEQRQPSFFKRLVRWLQPNLESYVFNVATLGETK